ncbi:GTP cyclohydrolase I FolE [Rathayibacter caricis]|uniref:GTP cyclohydrolase I FolE n=1 Tax=Rathayibacter caricis TaxID=110936 RepID=UPI001FB2967A|nr:GTP cyclohydrolase I FolE [Rathayibacter caricis]MCJ1695962.1 GTP cyclohydrolase I FolE [Rathayibacter caricis]
MSIDPAPSAALTEAIEIGYPHRDNALTMSEKITRIEHHFAAIMSTLGLDLEHDSLSRSPRRYAEMVVKELFPGLDRESFPRITTQDNSFGYVDALTETNIAIHSVCEHHFVPIVGYCHIAYIPGDRLVGLSKLNRVADYYGRRPQVQERLTTQIRAALALVLDTEDVAVVIDAVHFCVRMRGIKDQDAVTRTVDLGGRFRAGDDRRDLFAMLPKPLEMTI